MLRRAMNGWSGLLAMALGWGLMAPPAAADPSFELAGVELRPILDLRLRYEHVDQEGAFADNADGLTLRGRAGVEAVTRYDLTLLVELEGVTDVAFDDFNSTTNNRREFPVIADPDGIELNRAQITFTGLPKTDIIVGRQRIILNNARFVGNVGFRQNEQTFDAVRIRNSAVGPLRVQYVFIDQVQRIFGNRSPMGQFESATHVGQVDYNPHADHILSAYVLYTDLDEAPLASARTIGVRAQGAFRLPQDLKLPYEAEYAYQTGYGRNPLDPELSYLHLAGGLDAGGAGRGWHGGLLHTLGDLA